MARLADAAPPRSCSSTCACRRTCRWQRLAATALEWARGLLDGVESEVYVTAPGAGIADDHPLVGALAALTPLGLRRPSGRDGTRWFSDASPSRATASRPSTTARRAGTPDPEGREPGLDGLVKIAEVYARARRGSAGSA